MLSNLGSWATIVLWNQYDRLKSKALKMISSLQFHPFCGVKCQAGCSRMRTCFLMQTPCCQSRCLISVGRSHSTVNCWPKTLHFSVYFLCVSVCVWPALPDFTHTHTHMARLGQARDHANANAGCFCLFFPPLSSSSTVLMH